MSGTDGDAALAGDYAALRTGYGALRSVRGAVIVSGPEAAEYLQGQCSQDVATMAVGSAVDALLLEPDGKLCALVRVLRTTADRFVLDSTLGAEPLVAARLSRFRLRTKVEIDTVPEGEWRAVELRGPGVLEPDVAGGEVWALPVDWNGVVGIDLLGAAPAAAVVGEPRWCGAAAGEALRVEAGIPVMGRELDERTIAPEAGLVERTVSFTKGCYTGQELLARLDARGNRVPRRLCGLVPLGPWPPDVVERLEGAAAVAADGRQVGVVTSGAWCPGLGGPGALGYVHRSVDVPGSVHLALDDGDALVAEARPLPLVG